MSFKKPSALVGEVGDVQPMHCMVPSNEEFFRRNVPSEAIAAVVGCWVRVDDDWIAGDGSEFEVQRYPKFAQGRANRDTAGRYADARPEA